MEFKQNFLFYLYFCAIFNIIGQPSLLLLLLLLLLFNTYSASINFQCQCEGQVDRLAL